VGASGRSPNTGAKCAAASLEHFALKCFHIAHAGSRGAADNCQHLSKKCSKRKHAQRWRVESVFFRHKRRLGSALTTCGETAQGWEILVLTHHLMILRRIWSRFSTEHEALIDNQATYRE
jgi:hypothetical protein